MMKERIPISIFISILPVTCDSTYDIKVKITNYHLNIFSKRKCIC